ncbi:MAG TPA: hypothetical protein VKH43_13915 [Thermoanaerobaculia bacterium]|nr:hypothetical protein [Thermoanaerobaculia bacterium]
MEPDETVYAFRSDGVIKIIRKLDAAAAMARALEQCLPALMGGSDRRKAEAEVLNALAAWEEACRTDFTPTLVPRPES